MKIKYLFTAALMALGFTSLSAQANDPQIIPGQYIVQFKDKPAVDELSSSAERPGESGVQAAGAGAKRAANNAKVKSVQTKHGIKANSVLHEYSDVIVGFSAKLSATDVQKLKSDPNVAGVYPDYNISLGPITNEANPSDITPLAQTVTPKVGSLHQTRI